MLSDPYFGAFDKDMQLSYAVPGYGFAEIFGAREDDIREGDAAKSSTAARRTASPAF